MKNIKFITLIPLIILVIIHQIIELSDFSVGLSYGIAIGILILGIIPNEKYVKLKSLKKSLLKH